MTTDTMRLNNLPIIREGRPYAEDLKTDVENLQRVVGNLSSRENGGSTFHVDISRGDLKEALMPIRSKLNEAGPRTIQVSQKLSFDNPQERRQRSIANLLAMGADYVNLAKTVSTDLAALVDKFADDIGSIPNQGPKLLDFLKNAFSFAPANQS